LTTDNKRYTFDLSKRLGIEMAKIPTGEELERRCHELGIDLTGLLRTQSISGSSPRAADYELQRRLIEAERTIRESRLWLVALISAIASVASAATAQLALFMTR
jgi:hypothetical protein